MAFAERITAHKTPRILDVDGVFLFLLVVGMPFDAQYKYFDLYYKIVFGVVYVWCSNHWRKTNLHRDWFVEYFLVTL